ncbi:MAG: SLC13 family permease [Nitriliruptorales bacterium]|nr:SLC13 family permease [Nitriliruptorales bacterium]
MTDLGGDAWITAAVLAVAFGLLVWGRLAPSAVVLAATVFLLLVNVIDADQALSGFANPAPATVAALYVLARAAQKTGLLSPLTSRLLGRGRGRMGLARLLLPAAAASSFLNNTPLVAMLTPDVVGWADRRGVSASRFLMPLSFATILGGTVTVLGTSTNLVVSGLLEESGQEPFGLFELASVGGPVALLGLAVLVTTAWHLAPERRTAKEQAAEEVREFVVFMEVESGGALEGQRIADTPLVGRRHVFLVEVARDGHTMSPVNLDTVLHAGDRLTFAGQVGQIVELHRMRGLRSTAQQHLEAVASPEHGLYVAVVGRTSPIAGRTLADVDFIDRYQAAVLAVHRDGHRLTEEPRDVRLRPGDTLLILADQAFQRNWGERRDFLIIAPLGGDPPTASAQAPVVAVIAGAMVAVAALGILPILEAALLAAGALVVTRVLSADEVRDAIDFDVIILIAAAFGLGAAVQTTGLASAVAEGLMSVFDALGTVGVVFGLLLAVSLLTELVTNNAAAVVVFPIAVSVAERTGLDMRAVAIAIAIAASSSFLTPIGYQTNTIVYGPGGYRFTDYLRVGAPLNLTVISVVTALTVASY